MLHIQSRDLGSLSESLLVLWNKALEKGAINFNPRNPNNYKEVKIGKYIKRIIPDRITKLSEKMSDELLPIKLPFSYKLGNFDYTKVKTAQKLLQVNLRIGKYFILASNSPLSIEPHCLLVPCRNRGQFITKVDIRACCEILKYNPDIVFIFSSLAGGAGVNHMHIHLIPGLSKYPTVYAMKRKILSDKGKINIHRLINWKSDLLIIEGNNNKLVNFATYVVGELQKNNMPHNILIKNGQIWVNPRSRKRCFAFKNKKFGSWETMLGICNCCSIKEYMTMTEIIFEKCLTEIMMNKEDNKLFNKIIYSYFKK